MSIKRKILISASYVALFLWMLLIFCMSAQTGVDSGDTSGSLIESFCDLLLPNFDELSESAKSDIVASFSLPIRKAAHFTEYFVLACLLNLAFTLSKSKAEMDRRTFIISFICGVVYAVTDEIHQLFVPGRAGTVIDVLIDSGGILCGCFAFVWIYKFVLKRRCKKAPTV